MVGPDGGPVAGEPVYVFAGDAQNLTLTTDRKGKAAFSFDTALWKDTVTLKVGRRSAGRSELPGVGMRFHRPMWPGEVEEDGGAGGLRAQPAAP